MGLREKMMEGMMNRMSASEKREMMDRMMAGNAPQKKANASRRIGSFS